MDRKKIKDHTEVSNYDPSLPARLRDYRLTKADYYLKKPLPHAIPVQYLLYSTEKEQRVKTIAHKPIVGVVVSSGKMQKTVRARVPYQQWNKRLKKVCSIFRCTHLQSMI